MSAIANSDGGGSKSEKPVHNDVKFPPFPEPTDEDFDEDIPEEERKYYKKKFCDLNTVKTARLHCSACDRHMGCSARNERLRAHPLLRTLVCHTCHTFYNSGEFEKGDDGSELYCRWCGQGGQVYCCSNCPHVFCAKCIKRNLGPAKIKDIENADDWKCFKCDPDCLKDLRAICWAVLRYCDLKNKITYQTEDPDLKAAFQKDCALDLSECCKHKTNKRNHRLNESMNKKKELKKETDNKASKETENKALKEADKALKEADNKASVAAVISKMPSTIQVKKFASLVPEESLKPEKKAQKRSASPKQKSILVKNPISIAPAKMLSPICLPPLAKKMRLPNCTGNTAIRLPNARTPINTYTRIRPKMTPIPIAGHSFNGFGGNMYHCNNPINDNINLSLESLTQGLDMAAVAALNNNTQDDDVVCTPDFPLEPLCEVTEDNDDDVECITPGPVVVPKFVNPPPLVPRISTVGTNTSVPSIPDVTPENIIQMTDNDVTVNESTGGLKFRVDPQTLSSNKMYRLPDGRIFAINANSNMPGGYSATIVAVTESNKSAPKGATFAAKVSSVSTSTPTPKVNRNNVTRFVNTKRVTGKIIKPTKTSEPTTRECDLNVPIEWYRYNLIDAVDALEYSLSRLNKLKKEATSVYLRTRSVNEMRNLHKNLERLLNTSSSRFNEIRENLNNGLKQYITKKVDGDKSAEDDDDVEILPDLDDDPIFIDENSMESNINGNENQEVDLTGPGSSEYNDSGENRNQSRTKGDSGTLNTSVNVDESLEQRELITSGKDRLIESESGNKKDCNDDNGIERTSEKNKETVPFFNNNLKCDEKMEEINGLAEGSSNYEEKNKSGNGDNMSEITSQNKADSNVADEKKLHTDETLLSTDNKIDKDSSNEIHNVDDKTKDSDAEILEDSDDKVQEDGDDKMQEDGDDKRQVDGDDKNQEYGGDRIHDSDDKIQDLDDKILEDADDKIQEDANDKMQENSDDKMLEEADDKMQEDADDKMQEDADDKIQDTEMTEELIETLLKDDSSQDNATNSDVPEALQVN